MGRGLQAEQAVDAAAKAAAARAALEQGYCRALAINGTNTDALVTPYNHVMRRGLSKTSSSRAWSYGSRDTFNL